VHLSSDRNEYGMAKIEQGHILEILDKFNKHSNFGITQYDDSSKIILAKYRSIYGMSKNSW